MGERVDQEQSTAVLAVGVGVEAVVAAGLPVRRPGQAPTLVGDPAAQGGGAEGQGEPVAAARVHDGVGGKFADQQFGDVDQVVEAVLGEPFADESPGPADRGLSRTQDRGAALAHGRQASWTVVRHGRFPSALGRSTRERRGRLRRRTRPRIHHASALPFGARGELPECVGRFVNLPAREPSSSGWSTPPSDRHRTAAPRTRGAHGSATARPPAVPHQSAGDRQPPRLGALPTAAGETRQPDGWADALPCHGYPRHRSRLRKWTPCTVGAGSGRSIRSLALPPEGSFPTGHARNPSHHDHPWISRAPTARESPGPPGSRTPPAVRLSRVVRLRRRSDGPARWCSRGAVTPPTAPRPRPIRRPRPRSPDTARSPGRRHPADGGP